MDELIIQTDNGYFTLNWTSKADHAVVLERASDPDFKDAIIIYQGLDKSRFVSGLKNGTYYYRIKETGENVWSPTLEVQVEHPSLTLALTLFFIGAMVFFITVVVIIKGSKESNSKIA